MRNRAMLVNRNPQFQAQNQRSSDIPTGPLVGRVVVVRGAVAGTIGETAILAGRCVTSVSDVGVDVDGATDVDVAADSTGFSVVGDIMGADAGVTVFGGSPWRETTAYIPMPAPKPATSSAPATIAINKPEDDDLAAGGP
jgi:hypothetical protein